MSGYRLKIFLIICLFIFFSSANAAQQLLRIHGSNTVGAALAPKLVRGWLSENNYAVVSDYETDAEERLIAAKNHAGDVLKIEIHAHGSSTSFRSLGAGIADIGMSSRPIKKKEIKKLAALGKMDSSESEYIIAIDGLAVIVNKTNPLRQIDKNKLKDIFSGKIKNWSELGPIKGRINVYARDDKSGTYDTFKNLVLSKKVALTRTARRYESNARLSDDVSQDPNGIGFVGLAYIRNSQALAISEGSALALYPDEFNVATEDYILSRRLFLYVPENNRHALAKSFVEFSGSRKGQEIAAKVGFVSQQVIAYDKPPVINAPEEFKKFTINAKRLSLNIRFRKGMTILDNKALHDVERLIGYMKQPENQQKRLMLFGFADADEVIPYMSLSLSIERADRVSDVLQRFHLNPVRVRGYGQELPVSSNKTLQGRIRNRRVEVWVHDKS